MTTARDIMKPGAQWISKDETVEKAARIMAELGVGSLVISDENERMCGIVTDRDIVVKCIAQGLPRAKPGSPTCARRRRAGSTRTPTSRSCSTRWKVIGSSGSR